MLVQEPRAGHYDATSFVCTGSPGDPANCLTAAEAAVVNKIWNGPVNAKGEKIWFGLESGASLAGLAGTSPFSIAVDHFRYWQATCRFGGWLEAAASSLRKGGGQED